MRQTAFFSGAIIVLAVTPSQMAAVEPSSLTPTVDFASSLQRGTTAQPTFLISPQSRTQRILFAPGAVSAVVEGSVVRGTRNIYLLRARKDQTIILNIRSLEKNAVFDIQAPDGSFLEQEASTWRGLLPRTGDYSVIVGATRGNASYKLEVIIK